MFVLRRPEPKSSPVDKVIEELVSEMAGFDGQSEEFRDMAVNLKTLLEAKAAEPRQEKLSVNTIAVIAANLVGIAMILGFERMNVVTSKGLNFVMRPKA